METVGAPHTELPPPDPKMEVGAMLLPHMSLDLEELGVAPRLMVEDWLLLMELPPPNCCIMLLASASLVMLAWMVVLFRRQLLRAFWALAASRPELYMTRAIPLLRNKWNLLRGPCWMQSVFKVAPSIWGVRFFNKSQVGMSERLPLAPFWPEDQPLEEAVVLGHPPRPGGVRPDLPQRS